MKFDYSDREMEQLLQEATIIEIDERTDEFWDVNRDWVPPGQQNATFQFWPIVNGPDKIYGRYTLGTLGQGTRTEDYSVLDRKNKNFDHPLPEFLDMQARGELPTKEQEISIIGRVIRLVRK